MKVADWLAAPLPVVERGEREAFARDLYGHELDIPTSCDCGVLALCRRHRMEVEQRERERAETLARARQRLVLT